VVFSGSSGSPRASRPDLWRNLALDLSVAVGIGTTTALVGALLPTVARREGLAPIGLAALAAAPFLANFLSVFTGRFGPRTPQQLAVTRMIGAALLITLAFVPIPSLKIPVAIAFWISVAFGLPYQLRLWGTMYPGPIRGRIIGLIGTGRAAAAGIAALTGGVLADRIGGADAVALAGIFGLVCAVAAAGLRAQETGEVPRYSAMASLRSLRAQPVLMRLGLAQAFYGGGLIAAAPLYVLVYVDRLGLTLTDVGVIGVLAAVASTVASLVWGAIADRRGGMTGMRIGSLLGVASVFAYAFAPGIGALWVAAVFIGIANASIDVGLLSVLSEQTPLEDRAAVLGGWNALTGLRGIAAPFIAGGLVGAGIIDLQGGLLLCALVAAVGAWLYLNTAAEVGMPAPELRWMGVDRGLRRARVLAGRAHVGALDGTTLARRRYARWASQSHEA
jgi:MFS family permease